MEHDEEGGAQSVQSGVIYFRTVQEIEFGRERRNRLWRSDTQMVTCSTPRWKFSEHDVLFWTCTIIKEAGRTAGIRTCSFVLHVTEVCHDRNEENA